MNILITNDDGYLAKGIITLANILSKKHKITVVAPNKGYSGYSHAMNFYKKVKFRQVFDFDYDCFVLEGTPCDCVKFGVEYILKQKVDLIIGGINDVLNLGTDYFYSGTVNIAIEGAHLNFKSIAISGDCKEQKHYDYIANVVEENLEYFSSIMKNNVPLSINIQNNSYKNKGFKFANLGKQLYDDNYIIEYINGENFYSLVGETLEVKTNDKDCDINLFKEGFSTISPINLDWNNLSALAELKNK